MASAIGDVLPLSTMQFASGGESFRITGTPIPCSVAALDAGIDLALTSLATLGIGYGGQFGSGASDQTLHARFRLGAMKRRSRLQSRAPARECGALSICEATWFPARSQRGLFPPRIQETIGLPFSPCCPGPATEARA